MQHLRNNSYITSGLPKVCFVSFQSCRTGSRCFDFLITTLQTIF